MIWKKNDLAAKLPIDPSDTYILTDFDRTLTLGLKYSLKKTNVRIVQNVRSFSVKRPHVHIQT